MAITTPTIRNDFNLSAAPPDWLLTDTTDYTTFGLVAANVKGNFKLTAPNGIIHDNTNFATPDTDLGAGDDDYTQALPLDSNNEVLEGTYAWQYTIQVTRNLTNVDQGNRAFSIGGNRVDDIVQAGTITIDGSTGNDGTYTVSGTPIFNGVDTVITVVEAIPSAIVDGTLVYLLVNTGTFNYCFEEPTVSITITIDCPSSQLESKDESNYTATCGSTQLIPVSITRTHTVIYPQGIQPQPANIVSSADTITVTPIYTKAWQTTISTDLVYQNSDGLFINVTVTGQRTAIVDCDVNLCALSDCLQVLVNNYKIALRENYATVARSQEFVMKAYGYYMLYSIAIACGEIDEACVYLAELKALVAAAGCTCSCGSNSADPIQVVPIYGISGGTGNTSVVTTTLNGITVSAVTVGTTTTYTLSLDYTLISSNLKASLVQVQAGTNDVLFITPLKLAQYFAALGTNRTIETNGSGALIGAVKNTAYNTNFGVNNGDTPEIASTLAPSSRVQTNGSGQLITVAGQDPYDLLSNDQTPVSAPSLAGENTLQTYTLAAGTLGVNGDYVRITSTWEFSTASPQAFNARLYFGTYAYDLAPLFPTNVGFVTAVMEVVRTGAATQNVYLTVIVSGIPAQTYLINPVATGENLAANVVIRTTSQFPSFPSRPNTLISDQLRVELFRI